VPVAVLTEQAFHVVPMHGSKDVGPRLLAKLLEQLTELGGISKRCAIWGTRSRDPEHVLLRCAFRQHERGRLETRPAGACARSGPLHRLLQDQGPEGPIDLRDLQQGSIRTREDASEKSYRATACTPDDNPVRFGCNPSALPGPLLSPPPRQRALPVRYTRAERDRYSRYDHARSLADGLPFVARRRQHADRTPCCPK
jgi:hypothetical protein